MGLIKDIIDANSIEQKRRLANRLPIAMEDKNSLINNKNNAGEGGGSSSGSRWTGHADVEGLKAIGWTDEDIAYYQANGVNWNEEDDAYHKVPEDNIALYGVLTADNISTYKDKIVYLPKIDTSGVTDMTSMFYNCTKLVSIPMIDTSNVITMYDAFDFCYELVCIPKLNTSKVTNMSCMFYGCGGLETIPALDTSSVTNMESMFDSSGLVIAPEINTSNVNNIGYLFNGAVALKYTGIIDAQNATTIENIFNTNHFLKSFKIKNLKSSITLDDSINLLKDSLMYIINNEAATSAITITLNRYCYNKYSADADVVSALNNHPNVTLVQKQ